MAQTRRFVKGIGNIRGMQNAPVLRILRRHDAADVIWAKFNDESLHEDAKVDSEIITAQEQCMAAMNEGRVDVPQWRPITTHPGDDRPVLVAYENGLVTPAQFFVHDTGMLDDHRRWEPMFSPGLPGVAAPTHWMPFPAAPNGLVGPVPGVDWRQWFAATEPAEVKSSP